MLYVLIGLWVVLFIVLIVLAFIWNDEDEIINTDNKAKENIVKEIKNSRLEKSVFSKWLNNFEIKNEKILEIKTELNKKIVWMEDFVNALLINIFAQWHMLVEWVPWLAKTKTITTISDIMDMDSSRIQFTPDMMPSDLIWVEIFNSKTQEFEVKKWPVFTNILLADEINRTTPKVQSALLEAMQEKQVSIWSYTYKLDKPFFVLATQNPIEQEWTYQLPEAQLDRFIFKAIVDYPSLEEETKILNSIQDESKIEVNKVLDKEWYSNIIEEINNVMVSDSIKDYIARLIQSTRSWDSRIYYWASPRWSIALFQWSKVLAYMNNRDYVLHEDVQNIALLALRHRVVLTYDAIIDWNEVDDVLIDVLSTVNLE